MIPVIGQFMQRRQQAARIRDSREKDQTSINQVNTFMSSPPKAAPRRERSWEETEQMNWAKNQVDAENKARFGKS